MNSRRFQLNAQDLVKLGKSALIAGVTAAILFVLAAIPQIDLSVLGTWAAPVGALATFGVNYARKFLAGPTS